jgi:hypothetical protein
MGFVINISHDDDDVRFVLDQHADDDDDVRFVLDQHANDEIFITNPIGTRNLIILLLICNWF